MISFEKCDVTVNGTGIMADSASISSSNPIEKIGILGQRGAYTNSFEGAFQSDIRISYFLEPNNEPIYSLVNQIKQFNAITFPAIPIIIGGITGQGYLKTYNINVATNDIVKASAEFICFAPTSGTLVESNGSITYNEDNAEGLAHYFSSAVISKYDNLSRTNQVWEESINLNNLSYSFSTNWAPMTYVGMRYPKYVKLLEAQESIEISHEYLKNLEMTKQDPISFVTSNTYNSRNLNKSMNIGKNSIVDLGVMLYPYSEAIIDNTVKSQNVPFISIKNGLVKSNSIDSQSSSVLKVSTNIVRFY
jgi:hypothetical protein